MDIAQTLQTVGDTVTKLRKLSKEIENVDFKMFLAELTSEVADARLEAANLKEELAKARMRIGDLEGRLAQKEAIEPKYVAGFYQFPGSDDCFCPNCWDTRQLKSRVQLVTGAFRAFGKFKCPVCDRHYSGEG